jgi:endo-1,4-beta-xylanase
LRRNDGDAVAQHRKDSCAVLNRWSVDMFECSRRKSLAVLAGATVAMQGGAFGAPQTQSLGTIAAKNGLMFGAAAGPVIDKDVGYRELYTTQTKIITTDIALKLGTLAPQPGPKRFESADSDARSLSDLERMGAAVDQVNEQFGAADFSR